MNCRKKQACNQYIKNIAVHLCVTYRDFKSLGTKHVHTSLQVGIIDLGEELLPVIQIVAKINQHDDKNTKVNNI